MRVNKAFLVAPAARVGRCLLFGSLLAACGPTAEDPNYRFGKEDLESALLGAWTGTWTPNAGEPSAFELELRRPDDPPASSACNRRVLLEPDGTPGLAVQCASSSAMAVAATATVGDAIPAQELDGLIEVDGLLLHEAFVSLARDGAAFSLYAEWSVDGFRSCSARDGQGEIAVCTLERRSP